MSSADFSRYMNNNVANAPINSVRFGAQSPVLEVELNEAQELAGNKLSQLASIIGNCIINNNVLTYNVIMYNGVIYDCFAFPYGMKFLVGGIVIDMSGLSMSFDSSIPDGTKLELCVRNVEYTHGDKIPNRGFITSPSGILSHAPHIEQEYSDYVIKDPTMDIITTRRKGYEFWIDTVDKIYELDEAPYYRSSDDNITFDVDITNRGSTDATCESIWNCNGGFNGSILNGISNINNKIAEEANNIKNVSASVANILDEYNYYRESTGSLGANATSLVITVPKIATSDVVEIYSSVYGISPKTVAIADKDDNYSTVTMTFNSSHPATTIKIVRKKRG